MKNNFVILVLLAALAVTLSNAFNASAQQPPIVGGYSDASKTDPEVLAAAGFAIKQERRKLGRHLALISVERAEVQVVAGLNYRLCLKVRIKDRVKEATAVVYRNLKQKYSLSSWAAGKCKTAS